MDVKRILDSTSNKKTEQEIIAEVKSEIKNDVNIIEKIESDELDFINEKSASSNI